MDWAIFTRIFTPNSLRNLFQFARIWILILSIPTFKSLNIPRFFTKIWHIFAYSLLCRIIGRSLTSASCRSFTPKIIASRSFTRFWPYSLLFSRTFSIPLQRFIVFFIPLFYVDNHASFSTHVVKIISLWIIPRQCWSWPWIVQKLRRFFLSSHRRSHWTFVLQKHCHMGFINLYVISKLFWFLIAICVRVHRPENEWLLRVSKTLIKLRLLKSSLLLA